jgi:hypothetical protein
MFPFEVDPGWYNRYWLTDRPRRRRKPSHAGLASLAVLMVLLAGSSLVLNHFHTQTVVGGYQAWEDE